MRVRFTLGLVGVALVATTVSAAAQAPAPTPRYLLMVVSKQQPGMALYDAETDRLHCRSANLGVAPHEGEFSPDGRMAYVPTYGSSAVGQPGTDEHEIHFIRTSDCQTVYTLDTGDYKRPHHVQVGRTSGTIYVTAELKESILVIDPETRQITGTVPTGSNTTHMIALSADERTIVTSNVMGRTLSIVDVPGRRVAKTVPTETSNQRIVISPDQQQFVTNLGQARQVAFFRIDGTPDFTVDVDGSPFVSAYSADGRFVYVMGSAPAGPRGGGGARRGGGPGAAGAPGGARQGAPAAVPGGPVGGNLRAWKIDVASRAVVGTITENLGSGAGALLVNPANGRVYMTAMAHDLISIIDPDSWTVVKTIAAEDNPDGMAFVRVQ